MGNSFPSYRFRGRTFVIAFLLFISLSVTLISAQEDGIDESSTSIKDLGRRNKMFVDKIKTGINEKNDPDSYGVDVDSGLGIFDGFFASLSMILVSEVSELFFIVLASYLSELAWWNFSSAWIVMVCALGLVILVLTFCWVIGVFYLFYHFRG